MNHNYTTKFASTERQTPFDIPSRPGRSENLGEDSGFPFSRCSRKDKPTVGVPRKLYSGSIYPNGEFTVGFVGVQKKRVSEKRYDRELAQGVDVVRPDQDAIDTTIGLTVVPHHERVFKKNPNLVTCPELSQRKNTYGKTGITSYGKRMVRNGAARIQVVNTLERTGFTTLTLPNLPDAIRRAIAHDWGKLVKKYFQEVKRQHERHGRPFSYVAVTEIQTQRWKDTGNPGFHIHYCCPLYKMSPKRGDYLVTSDWIRSTWQRLLQNVADSTPLDGVEFTVPVPRVDIQKVKSSASAYLSKYMSKGADLASQVAEDEGSEYIPRQWWSMSSNLRDWVKEHTLGLSQEGIDCLFHAMDDRGVTFLNYFYRIFIKHPMRGDICIAASGKVCADIPISALGNGGR